MTKRVLVSSFLAVVAVGGITAGGVAMASAATEPTLTHGSARYVPPTDSRAGTFTYTADVSDDSGIRGLNVVAWPASSELAPTEADLRYVDAAKCTRTSDETSRCAYTFKVTKKEAAEAAKGTWNVSALLTAKDGNTLHVPDAATFEMKG
ncbi:DUF5707 domain-containing protein [Streptomyces pseudovenezuelae]|uniref:DUF11 domain-containing protein n=1 Tax=Streptomyces pseudovenezuelae TaxID=67350 RepID=A0ABT6LF18_9ACTN|nr:DUF5707 domain-containing protein [Streptomyces pseudovenezuelae]MDH6214899.1 hypothetical protein [Streptomyces pseudovenezuelae]